MTAPDSFDRSPISPLDLDPTEPLTPSARDAREAMLEPLRARVVAHRRRRRAGRTGAACLVAAAAMLSVQLLTTPSPTRTRETQTAIQPPPAPPVSPPSTNTAPEQPRKFAITIIQTDPTVVQRLSAKPPAKSLVRSLTDAELLDALEAAGTPGLIKINGNVVLSRDLFTPTAAETEPQSLAPPADHTHG